MQQTLDTKLKESLGEAIAEKYFGSRGFSAMNKKDIELLVFAIIRTSEAYRDMSNFDLSVKLGLPETRIKNLDYEARLAYPKYWEDKKMLLLEYISKASYDKTTEKFRFIIENKFDRLYLESKAKKMGELVDTSFNTEIVVISKEALVNLLVSVYGSDDNDVNALCRDLGDQARLYEDASGKLDVKRVFSKFVEGVAEGVGESLVKILFGAVNPFGVFAKVIKLLKK